jgi:hypothetical protein
MRFSKWHALGNSYLLVGRADLAVPLDPDAVRRACDADIGVGSDGQRGMGSARTTPGPRAAVPGVGVTGTCPGRVSSGIFLVRVQPSSSPIRLSSARKLRFTAVRAVTPDPDMLLIAAMREPPPLEDARGSLEFWRRRRSGLPIYRRSARREADEMIRRWQERVLAAERRRYGEGLLGFLRRHLAGDRQSWTLTRAGFAARVWQLIPRRLVLLAGAFATVWLLVGVLTLVVLVRLVA